MNTNTRECFADLCASVFWWPIRPCIGFVSFPASWVAAIHEEEMVNAGADFGRKVCLCGEPATFRRDVGRVEYVELEGGCRFLCKCLPPVCEGRFVKNGAQLVEGFVRDFLPVRRLVRKPLQQVRNSVGSNAFEGRSLLYCEFTMQIDDPFVEPFAFIGWLTVGEQNERGGKACKKDCTRGKPFPPLSHETGLALPAQ